MRRLAAILVALLVLLILLAIGLRSESALRSGFGGFTAATRLPTVPEAPEADAHDDIPIGYATVRCEYAGDKSPGELRAEALDGTAKVSGHVDGTTLRLELAPGEWRILWHHHDRDDGLGRLRLDEGDAVTCTLGTRVTLTGTVKTPDGRPTAGARVHGCGHDLRVGEDGAFTLDFAAKACMVQASYEDGVLHRESDPFVYQPFAPTTTVAFVLDDAPVAGVGIALAVERGKVLVDDIVAGTPADRAGLLPGDVIESVDGHAVAGMDVHTVVPMITGTPDTSVRLTITHDGATKDVVLGRERIEPPKDTASAP